MLFKPRLYDRLAKGVEAPHVQGDVVIDQENGPGAVIAGVAYVRQYPIERIGVKLATPHRDDRTETTIESTATRGLDDIDLAAEHSITVQNPRIAVGGP